MVVENVFGWLKEHWRCLQMQIDVHVDNAVTAIGACVVLVRQIVGDHYLEDWTQEDPLDDITVLDMVIQE